LSPCPVDYDRYAEGYGRRYELESFDGLTAALLAMTTGAARILEVGCGTGHWLRALAGQGAVVVGLDPSRAMMRQVHRPSSPLLTLGRAERLPFATKAFDRVLAIYALHHFSSRPAFFGEAHRALTPGGRIATVGLDPLQGRDRWWIYEYFPEADALDRSRCPSSAAIREELAVAGFGRLETRTVQNIRAETDATTAQRTGLLERSFTSQLAALSDRAYREGCERVWSAAEDAASRGTQLMLTTDLRLYMTTGVKG